MILAPGKRRGKGRGGPPRGSSFNTRNRVVLWGRVGGHVPVVGAEVWWSRAAGEPEAGPAPACPCCVLCVCVCACMCVCQALPVLPVRTGCELVASCRVLVPRGAGWCLQGRLDPASTWAGVGDVTVVTLWLPLRLLRCVCAGRGYGGACPFLLCRDEGNMCACMCVCARGVLFNVYISTIYTLRSWGPYIYSIPCLGSAGSKGQNNFAGGTETP